MRSRRGRAPSPVSLIELGACGHPLDAQQMGVGDLLPGFSRVDAGGVVRLARRQAEGYAYIRP